MPRETVESGSQESRLGTGWLGRAILLGVAQADPNLPNDPTKFKYGGARDPELAKAISLENPSRASIVGDYIIKGNQVALVNTLDALENPERRSRQAVERARASFKEMRDQNPRFSEYSDEDLIALLKKRVSSYDARGRRNASSTNNAEGSQRRKRERKTPPEIDVVAHWKDEPNSFLDHLLRKELPPVGSE